MSRGGAPPCPSDGAAAGVRGAGTEGFPEPRETQQPGQRGARLLELVQPVHQLVHRVEQLRGVQRAGGDGGQGHHSVQIERAADDQHRGHRQGVTGVAQREEDIAQPQGVAFGGIGAGDVLVELVHPAGGQPQPVDRTGALDGLRQALGQPRVGGGLEQIPLVRPSQVPAGRAEQHRDRDQARQQQDRADQRQGTEGEPEDADRGQGRRDRGTDGVGEQVDVPGRPGDQVTAVRVLDDLRRQGEQVRHEFLAQCGEDLLAERGGGVPRETYQHGLAGQAAEDQQDQAFHRVLALGHVRDQGAEQPRGEQPARRGAPLQGDHQAELGAVGQDGAPHIRAEFTARGDGQRAHTAAVQRSTRDR